MAFDNIKLEKGLYSTSKGFTAALEEIDPSENYTGTELEGLDAYQRQLKRFDIKVSGSGSDCVAKFFQTTDSAALFPEYISRAVQQGIEGADTLSKIIATTTNIDSMDYRAIESVPGNEDRELAELAEGAKIPETAIKTKEKLTKLHKRGRMLSASYEAIKFQKLDLFTVTLRQIGAYIAKSQMDDAMFTIAEQEMFCINSTKPLTYRHIVDLWSAFTNYNMTTMIACPSDIADMLEMSEFRDSTAGLDCHGTGKMITPFGAKIIKYNYPNTGTIIALDKNAAIEKVQAGGVMTEYDKLIDRQLEIVSITAIAGFSTIFTDAIKALSLDED